MTTTPITGDVWGDEVERSRAYILKEAEKPFPELRAGFENAYAAFVDQLSDVTDEQATFKPGRGEGEEDYSVAEVTRHIIQILPLMGARIRALARGEEPPPTQGPGSLGGHEGEPLSRLALFLSAARSELLSGVASVEGQEDLEPQMAHRLFGELNCRGWLAMSTLHVEDHSRQIGKVKAHAGYPKT
jgi:hypothetical protein